MSEKSEAVEMHSRVLFMMLAIEIVLDEVFSVETKSFARLLCIAIATVWQFSTWREKLDSMSIYRICLSISMNSRSVVIMVP